MSEKAQAPLGGESANQCPPTSPTQQPKKSAWRWLKWVILAVALGCGVGSYFAAGWLAWTLAGTAVAGFFSTLCVEITEEPAQAITALAAGIVGAVGAAIFLGPVGMAVAMLGAVIAYGAGEIITVVWTTAAEKAFAQAK